MRDKRGVWRLPADRGAPAAREGVEAAAPLPRRRGYLRGVVHRREEAGPRAVYQQVSQVPGGSRPGRGILLLCVSPVNGSHVVAPAGRSASVPLSTVPILQLGRGGSPACPPALPPSASALHPRRSCQPAVPSLRRIAGHPLAQNERCLHMFLQEEAIDRNYVPGKVRQ